MTIKDLEIKERSISVTYSLEMEGIERAYQLRQVYPEVIKDIKGISEMGALMSLVPAINYTLFTDEIRIEFPINELDLRFFTDMSEIVAKDIFVNRIVNRTGLIREEFVPDPSEISPEDAIPRADMDVRTTNSTDLEEISGEESCGVMVSGGKDSLLSYSLLNEVGCLTYPFFLNEAGRHWLVALKAYRYFNENVSRTRRVWSNIDRLFTFIEKNMRIVIPHFLRKSKEIYPVRLFWFQHYAFAFMPLIMKYNIRNIVFGNEFDDPSGTSFDFQGIHHYNATYDQSQDFEKYMTAWYRDRGLGIRQWSPIRSISGLVVERILHKRYPAMIRLQMSCHSPVFRSGKLVPCGRCFKCTGIRLFLLANGIDPFLLGYERQMDDLMRKIVKGEYRIDEDELEHSLYLISRRIGRKLPRAVPHPHVETIHFDDISSHPDHIPIWELREKILSILGDYTMGYSILRDGRWEITSGDPLKLWV